MQVDQPRVACIGEAMGLVPAAALDEPEVPPDAQPAGAEANVAIGLAAAGVAVSWLGRVGADPLGAFLTTELAARGVDVGAVQVDPARPTGRYAKRPGIDADGEPATGMHYRRSGSAASAMNPEFLAVPAVAQRLAAARIVHVTGITAALSPECAAMVRALLGSPRDGTYEVGFDLNWREQMWPDGDPALVIELAAQADIVLTGADEARRVLGTDDPAALRRILPGPRLLVVKDGARRALVIDRAGAVLEQPALAVEVVEPVGAGDAFAAGFLAGQVRGEDPLRCLRRGHLGAAAVLTVAGDTASPLPLHLLDASAQEWADARIRAAGLTAR